MNFKQWLLTEEIWQNNTATVYHRTRPERVSTILSTVWQTAGGCMYGCGLYTTFSIESQFTDYMKRYGTSILKFKVTNLDQYVICHKTVAQQILGQNYKISDQLKRLNLTDLYAPEQIEKFDQMMEKGKFSSELAIKMYYENKNLENKAKGIIYYGSSDGYCLVKYPPVEDGTITMLGYANDVPTNDLVKMQELETNCKKNEQGKCESPWITSTSKVSVKTLYGLEKDKKPDYAKQITPSFSEILRMQKIDQESWNLFKEKLKDVKNRDGILKIILVKNNLKINDNTIKDLLQLAENKDEIAKLIIQYKKELTDNDVSYLLNYTTNKDEIAKLLGSENISKLSDDNVHALFYHTTRHDEIAKLIIQYKKELSTSNVYHCLFHATEKDQMINTIVRHKKELSADDVYNLIYYATNKDEIANLLGSENINKLNVTQISNLLQNATNPNEIANIIISYRNFEIEDVSEEEIINLIRYSKNKYLMAKILGPKYLSKLSNNDKFYLILGTNSEEQKKLLSYMGTDFLNKINYYDIDIDGLIYNKQKLLLKFILKNNLSKLNSHNITEMLEKEVFTAEELAEMYNRQGEKIDGEILEAILRFSKNLGNTLNLFAGKENISKGTILRLLINKTPKEVQNVFGPIDIDMDADNYTLNFVAMNTKHLKEFLEFLGPKMPEDINLHQIFLRPNIPVYDSMQVYLKYKKIGNKEIDELLRGNYIEDEMKENIHEILRALLDHNGGCLPSKQIEEFARVYDDKLKLIKLLFEKCPQQAKDEFIHIMGGDKYSRGSRNNDEILKFVFTKLKDITPIQVYQFLLTSNDIRAIADLLGEENIDKIDTNAVFFLLNFAQNFGQATPEQIAEVLGVERIKKLSDKNVQELLNSRNGKKIKRILQQYGRIPSE